MKIRSISEIRVVPWRQTLKTDLTKLIITFRNFAKAPKNVMAIVSHHIPA